MSQSYDGLTKKRQDFVDALIGRANGNAAEAARLAGYSSKRAAAEGWELRQDPSVQAAIAERLTGLAMAAEEILHRLTVQARHQASDFFRVISLNLKKCDDCGGLGGCDRCNKTRKVCSVCLDASDLCDGHRHGGDAILKPDLKAIQDAGLMHLVKKVDWKDGEQVIEFQDPQAALNLLGRHFKLFTEKVEHTGPGGGALTFREVVVERPVPAPVDGSTEPLEG